MVPLGNRVVIRYKSFVPVESMIVTCEPFKTFGKVIWKFLKDMWEFKTVL